LRGLDLVLETGERIVLHPGDRVSPGTRLEDRVRD
jgi:hypothetical protein